MTVNFALATRMNTQPFLASANVGDVERYTLDLTPWADDAGAIVSAQASIEYGSASIANEQLVDGVWSADVTALSRGECKITVTAKTATQTKKCIIKLKIKDSTCGDDYGQGCC